MILRFFKLLAMLAVYLCIVFSSLNAWAYVESGSGTALLMHGNDGDGDVLWDETSNANQGQLGSTAGAGANDPSWTVGNFDPGTVAGNLCRYATCLDYNIADYVIVPDANSLDITGDLTVEAWIHADDLTARRTIVSKWSTASNAVSSYRLRINNASDIEFCVSNTTTAPCATTNSNILGTGRLIHVAGTYTASTRQVAVWVNGVRQATTTAAVGFVINSTGTNVVIGSAYNNNPPTTIAGGNTSFDGRIDEVRIRNTVPDTTITGAPVFNPGPVINLVNHSTTTDSWVMYNGGGSTINLGGWVFQQCSSSANYVVPTTGTRTIAAGATVTITVGSGTDTGTNWFTANGTGATDISSLASSDCLRVYGQATTAANTVIDGVVWGADAGTGDDDLVAAGLWRDGTYVSTLSVLNRQTIQLFITSTAANLAGGDNEEGVIDWTRHPHAGFDGEGAVAGFGDHYTTTASVPTRNIPYRYFIEVPSGSPTLSVELWDADVGRGANDQGLNRDWQDGGSWNTTSTYRLINPSGTTVATFTGNATTGWDNAFMVPSGFRVSSPTQGRWTLEVDGTTGTNAADKNTMAPRVEGFQVYTDYLFVGAASTTTGTEIDHFYPYVHSGCNMTFYDFDFDNSAAGNQGNVSIRNSYGPNEIVHTFLENNLSDGSSWTANNLTDWGSGTVSQVIYGPFEVVSELNGTGVGGPNFATYELRTFAGGDQNDAGDADSDTNMINMYFPGDDDGPPTVPFLTQYVEEVFGNPLQIGTESQLWVRVSLVNPTNKTFTNATVTIEVPSDPQISGVQVLSTTQGSTSGTGPIVWTVGSVSAPGAELVYGLKVTPSGAGNITLTGTPGGTLNGTRGALDYTGRITAANSTGTMNLGPICQLQVPVGSTISTYVSLTSFSATPYQNGQALVEWETGTEIDNLGFNVLMAENPVGPYRQINSNIILGQINSTLPGRYYFQVNGLDPTKTYYFLLEDVELDNDKTLHGPIDLSFGGALTHFASSGFDPLSYTGGGMYTDGENYVPGTSNNEGGPAALPRTKVTQNDDGLLVELFPEPPRVTAHVYNGLTFWDLSAAGFSAHSDTTGLPQMLQRTLLLPVPLFEMGAMEIRDLQTASMALPPGEGIWPQPQYSADVTGTTVVEAFAQDQAAYQSSLLMPEKMVEFAGAKFVGERHLAQVKIAPVQYRASHNELVYATHIEIFLPFGKKLDRPTQTTLKSGVSADVQKQWEIAADTSAIKLRIKDAGFYTVGYADLLAAGFPVQEDPRRFQLFYDGVEQSILVLGEADGHFDANDAIVFRGKSSPDAQAELLNTYWLRVGSVSGLRMAEQDATPNTTPVVANSYLDTLHAEENKVFHSQSKEDDNYFWKYLVAPSSLYEANFNFTLTDVDFSSPETSVLHLAMHGVTSANANPDHHVVVELNQVQIMNFTFDGEVPDSQDVAIPTNVLVNGTNTLRVYLPGDLSGVQYDGAYVNWFELSYPRFFQARNDRLDFKSSLLGNYEVAGFMDGDVYVFDVSEDQPQRLQNVMVSAHGGAFDVAFRSPDRPFGANLSAVSRQSLKTVDEILPHVPSQVHGLSGDYLMIVPKLMMAEVMPLAEHRANNGLHPVVLPLEDIVDEFGFGNKSPQAVKDAIAHFSNGDPRARFVLLVGDGSLDPKVNMGLGDENFVPMPLVATSFMKTGSDVWYADLNGDLLPDLMIGRLPVQTPAQAQQFVEKIIAYEASGFENQPWEKTVSFVKDDVDAISAATDVEFSTTLDTLQTKIPKSYQQNLIGEEFQGTTADTKQAIIDAINHGTNVVNYVGHGSINLWASERIFENSDVAALTNENLPVVIAMDCLNAYYFFPTVRSLAEEMLLSPHGAIAFWSSSGLSRPTEQRLLNAGFYEALYPQGNGLAQTSQIKTMGEAINAASLSLSGSTATSDVLKTFTLLGDPALQLKVPTLSQINANPGQDAGLQPEKSSTVTSVESTGGCQAAVGESESFGMLFGFLLPLIFVAWFRTRKTL